MKIKMITYKPKSILPQKTFIHFKSQSLHFTCKQKLNLDSETCLLYYICKNDFSHQSCVAA